MENDLRVCFLLEMQPPLPFFNKPKTSHSKLSPNLIDLIIYLFSSGVIAG